MDNILIQDLIEKLNKLPGVTKKTSIKIANFLITNPEYDIESLIKSFESIKNNISICENCKYLKVANICKFCNSERVDFDSIMIVESINDVDKIEKTGIFCGRYFIWEFKPENNKKLILQDKEYKFINSFKNIILSLSPNLEGEVKSQYLINIFKEKNISKLAIGLPFGSQIDYIDEVTLKQAFNNRTKI
ncbi:toprim domain-containing protein [Mycoplasma sp. M5725]|uniref:Recombination protein RecR n=1 Tax=Mycoplasma phocimorsus TaxID=3045839 RepID=A0AAJ1PST5_9MOLU|nr:toprim domain-containing protein [Mycoplasma phocimorsus]MDJ1645864.1 toprim domain-containing protein [Mycoplasma phocimorsus]MDJ1646410.1 toprim domain-containing protein [Mycoplasma phocimorsus]